MDFPYFMAVFNETVEKKVDDPVGKLTWLIRYITGDESNKKNGIQLPAEIGFETAIQLLTERYGDPCSL